MADLSEPRDSIDAEEELVITDHRDRDEPYITPDEEEGIEVVEETPREALQEQGEDVASSPARRGHDNAPESDERD